MIQDVQYGQAVASVYDSLIASVMPLEDTLTRLHPYVAGARVLEIGVGTGRVAVPVASVAADVVGLDNSAAMLNEFRSKGLPANTTLVQADFRSPLPVNGPFDAAYSTMGSLACVCTRDELITTLTHIRGVLAPEATLSMEYYATAAYLPLVARHQLTVPTPHHGDSTTTFTVTLDSTDILTMHTRVEADSEPAVEFSESILLIERHEVEACLVQAGFTVEHVHADEGTQPYDWYIASATA